jgi:hypothetical protein
MSFLEAPAPMTAKATRCSVAEAEKVAASIVGEMRSWGFEIRPVETPN